MTVAIVDYGSGNLRSAAKAFERAAREDGVETRGVREADVEGELRGPGVGALDEAGGVFKLHQPTSLS